MRKIVAILRLTLDSAMQYPEPSNDPHNHRL